MSKDELCAFCIITRSRCLTSVPHAASTVIPMCMYDMQLEAAVTFVQGLRLSHFSSRNVAYCTPLPVGDEQTACSWIKREQDPADPTQHDAAACQIHCRWLCQSQSL